MGDAELRALSIDAIVSVQPILKDILDGAEETRIPAESIESVDAMLQRLESMGSPELQDVIAREVDRAGGLQSLVAAPAGVARRLVVGSWLRIAQPLWAAPDRFQFVVSGDAAGSVRVQRSEDLNVWITVRELFSEELPVVINDTPPAGAARQYYRLVVDP